MLNDTYVSECKKFKWLQEKFKNDDNDICGECDIELGEDWERDVYFTPRLDILIELMGDRFLTLSLDYGRKWSCWTREECKDLETLPDESFEADTPELACIYALKKIKENENGKVDGGGVETKHELCC